MPTEDDPRLADKPRPADAAVAVKEVRPDAAVSPAVIVPPPVPDDPGVPDTLDEPDGSGVEWFDDGGRKTALGAWAGVAVLAYAAMQVSGFLADWPFVALVAGALGYFAVRGVAVVLRELKRSRAS